MAQCFLICRLSKGFCEGLPTTQCWSEAVASHLEEPRVKIHVLGSVSLYDTKSFRSGLTGGKSTSILKVFFPFILQRIYSLFFSMSEQIAGK